VPLLLLCGFVLAVIATPGLFALIKALCPGGAKPKRVRITEESTGLWTLVRSVAPGRGPAVLHVDGGTSVEVRSRRLTIGLPLLMALSQPELKALLIKAFTQQGRSAQLAAAGARVLFRARETLSHAGNLGGLTRPDPVAQPPEEFQRAWRSYLTDYVPMALPLDLLPANPTDGFRQLLRGLGAESAGPYAAELLVAGEASLDHAFFALVTEEQRALPRAEWDTLVDLRMRYQVGRWATEIIGGLSLGEALDRLASGQLSTFAAPNAADLLASVRERLAVVVVAALADVGALRWEMRWPGPAEQVFATVERAHFVPCLDAAAAVEPEVLPLRARLVFAGGPGDYRPARSLSNRMQAEPVLRLG
jgi:hypothetical protein